MKTDTFFGKRMFPIIFMFLITAVCIAIVSGIFLTTKERVKLNESIFLKRAVLYAADIPVPEELNEIDALFGKRIDPVGGTGEDADYFQVSGPEGEQAGYVIFAYGPGLWGEITAVVGFEEDQETFTGVEFLKQNETPGLGARITEEWFKEQFRGKKAPFTLVPEGTAEAKNELDAITGASRTSNFVKQIMNTAAEEAVLIRE